MAKKTILVVEDEEALRKAMVFKLSAEGFQVVEAGNGEEGLAKAEQERPDIILLDILMPKMHGMEMLSRLRFSGEWGKNVPVIVLSNLNDAAKVAEATEGGVYDYLIKSDWKIEDLVKKVTDKIGPPK